MAILATSSLEMPEPAGMPAGMGGKPAPGMKRRRSSRVLFSGTPDTT